MQLKPYWAVPDIERIGLAKYVSSCILQPTEKILEAKRRTASRACEDVLKEDPEPEIVAVVGSVAHGDIIGWFSDIDLLVITEKPREERMVIVDRDVLFVEYHSWESLEELLVKNISRDEYEDRSSYLFFYGNPRFLHSSEEAEKRYGRIVKLGIEALWKDYSETDEYLDDFIWFYGSAREALRRNKPLTAIGKLQRGTILLLRYYLIRSRILLRKPLPDQRTIIQLQNSHVPGELVDFVGQLYRAELDIESLLKWGREMYLRTTKRRKFLNRILL